MQILLFDIGSYTYYDVKEYLVKMGHVVRGVYYSFENAYEDSYFEENFSKKIDEYSCDVIFSINFHPLVAKISNEHSIAYIAWSYDSPLSTKMMDYFSYDTNYLFLFDRAEVNRYRKLGFDRVFHMQLACNTDRLDKCFFSEEFKLKYSSDISFVGQLYNDCSMDNLKIFMDDYLKGYLDGVLNAQFELYGADIITMALTDDFLKKINKSFKLKGISVEPTKQGIALAIQKQITYMERSALIGALSEAFETKYYNLENYPFKGKVKSMGPVKYITEMPAVFKYSKLNLCPTIRSILSGIPLRAIDICGAGGLLFSNYQAELAEQFMDGRDCVIYSSLDEAIDKAIYYLKNGDERKKLAIRGHEIVKNEFTYEKRLSEIFEVVKTH